MGVAGAEAGSGRGPLALVVLVVSFTIRGIAVHGAFKFRFRAYASVATRMVEDGDGGQRSRHVGLADPISIAASLYSYTITGYGDTERLSGAASTRTLFISIMLAGFISVCGFIRFLGATAVLATGLQLVTITIYEAQWNWLVTAVWSVDVANDLLVAVTLVFLLYHQRRNALVRTIPLMNKLIIWTIVSEIRDPSIHTGSWSETGMLTSASSILKPILVLTISISATLIAETTFRKFYAMPGKCNG
ncbi:hypothetical protein GGX14DRAFT_594510 [Mycena pura]|uniref:Uncharacterized protein n=1 Tax=Mycena pura TaxID=153505 RepID=A0AAD6UXH7_9AGAR|nr:hypothetical protein GGX14DRAFT_594510 [Mycena pura]